MSDVLNLLKNTSVDSDLYKIAEKIINNKRITEEEGILLYEKGELGFLGILANFVREQKNGNKTYFNKNIHLEPTNICIYNCQFCSYGRKKGEDGSWDYSLNEIFEKVSHYKNSEITEIHIVGGVHPDRDLHYYGNMMQKIKEIIPHIHIKAFTAVEIDFMVKKSNMSLHEGLVALKNYGLDSIPGGGAEIFDEEVRKQICGEKSKTADWLKIHEAAHLAGIPSNATMLYGHVETYKHRIEHLSKLRNLQDKTGKFNAFIPLKFRKQNNLLTHIGEVSVIEDLRNYAVCRLFLDNIPHLKAYWVMIGKQTAQLSLSFGVDDVDGTIDDTTKIYTMAGAEEKFAGMTATQMIELIYQAKRIPVERDSCYNELKTY